MRDFERREEPRPSVRFQPACLEIDQKSHIALLRDVSRSGAGFESDLPLKVGQPIKYRWGNSEFTPGHVSWVNNGRFGVENAPGLTLSSSQTKFGYRSVRIPVGAETTVYIDEKPRGALLHNVGQRGLCLELPCNVRVGTMLSVKFGRMMLDAVTVKWSEGTRSGLALRESLRIGEMAQAIRHYDAVA